MEHSHPSKAIYFNYHSLDVIECDPPSNLHTINKQKYYHSQRKQFLYSLKCLACVENYKCRLSEAAWLWDSVRAISFLCRRYESPIPSPPVLLYSCSFISSIPLIEKWNPDCKICPTRVHATSLARYREANGTWSLNEWTYSHIACVSLRTSSKIES